VAETITTKLTIPALEATTPQSFTLTQPVDQPTISDGPFPSACFATRVGLLNNTLLAAHIAGAEQR
jgi:hypothetical protein